MTSKCLRNCNGRNTDIIFLPNSLLKPRSISATQCTNTVQQHSGVRKCLALKLHVDCNSPPVADDLTPTTSPSPLLPPSSPPLPQLMLYRASRELAVRK